MVGNMEAIDAYMAGVVFGNALGVIRLREKSRIAPCIAEIVLRTRSKRGGELFAVDVDFLDRKSVV